MKSADKTDAPKHSQRRQREHAVALQYCDADSLPSVAASGIGEIARQIIAIAKEYDIPIHNDEVLSEMLSGLATGAEISPDSYKLVAEVISFLYHTDKEWQEEHGFLDDIMS